MADAVSRLVAALGPLQSQQARSLMWVLAFKSDESGDCGVIPLKELARLSQIPYESLPKLVNDLEDHYGLIQKIEQGRAEPSRFRICLDRLASPHAHLKQDVTMFKAVLGPAAGQRFPVPEVPLDQRQTIVTNPTGKLGLPLVYRITPWVFLPIYMTQEVDGVEHVYRLSSRTWQYTGTSISALTAYGAGVSSLKRLRDADVLSMEELGHKIELWKRRSGTEDPTPATFGPALLRMTAAAHYLSSTDVTPLKTEGARTVLAGYRAWRTWQENPRRASH